MCIGMLANAEGIMKTCLDEPTGKYANTAVVWTSYSRKVCPLETCPTLGLCQHLVPDVWTVKFTPQPIPLSAQCRPRTVLSRISARLCPTAGCDEDLTFEGHHTTKEQER